MNATTEKSAPFHSTPIARKPLSPDEPKTLVEVFEQLVVRHPRPDTLNFKAGEWRSISSAQFMERIHRIAAGLYALGVRRGDRVAMLSESRPEWTLADAGCLFAGAIDVPIYPTLTPPQAAYILKDSGARVIFISRGEKLEQMREVVKGVAQLEHVILFDNSDDADAITLADLEARGGQLLVEQPDLLAQISHQISPDDLATIIYTSGTTGEPKGVMLTHSNLVTNVIDSAGHFEFNQTDCVLSVLPLSHIFERTAMYMYLHNGMAVYYAESLETIGANLKEVRPTILVGVPRIFEKIYGRVKEKAAEKGKFNVALLNWAVEAAKEYARLRLAHQTVPVWLKMKHAFADKLMFSKMRAGLGGRIRLLISGGAALPEDLGYLYIGAGLPIVQGYGLTETAPVITAGRMEDNRIGTVGKPIDNVEVRIAPDGEIETRGPNVMRGYYNKPVETAAVFTEDGWFKTGDIGTLDEDGYLRITDRKKELFKTSGGKYIAPQQIEQLIKGSRFVNQVVLIGNGRKFPSALIVPEWEMLESYAQLKGLEIKSRAEFCKHPRIVDLFERQIASLTTDLAQFERVKKIALLEHELTIEGGELTPTMKVKRRVVDEKYAQVIDRIYADAENQSRPNPGISLPDGK